MELEMNILRTLTYLLFRLDVRTMKSGHRRASENSGDGKPGCGGAEYVRSMTCDWKR